MEDNAPRIFTNKAISFATFLGGPIAAGFLISKNFKEFGNHSAARNSIFIGIISTIILFAGIFMIPETVVDKIPQFLIPAIYTGVIALLVEKLQGNKIRDFLSSGGKKASNWQTTKYGIIGLVAILMFLAIVIFSVPTKGYEKSILVIKNVKLHYPKEMNRATPQRLAKIIRESQFMEESQGADLYFSNTGTIYKLKFILNNISWLSDTALMQNFDEYEKYLNYNLKLDKRIVIGFTDPTLQENYSLPATNTSRFETYQSLLNLRSYQASSFHTIYYSANMPIEDVKKVEDAVTRLKTYFPANQRIDIVFLNNGNDYTIKFFSAKQLWESSDFVNKMNSILEYIEDCGINKKIKLVLVDNKTHQEKQILTK